MMRKKVLIGLIVSALAGIPIAGFAATANTASDPWTFSGDVRLRFDKQANFNKDDFDASKYRIRLNAGYKFSPEWRFDTRITVGESLFRTGPKSTTGYTTVPDDVQIDIASLTYKQPDWSATMGRQKFTIFEGLAVSMDDGHNVGDAGYSAADNRPDGGRARNYPGLQGVKLQNKSGKVNFTSFYGNLNDRNDNGANYNVKGIAAMTPLNKVNVGAMWYTTDSSIFGTDLTKYPGLKNGTKTGYSLTANTKLFKNYLYTGTEYIWGLADDHDKAWKLIARTPATKKPGDMQYSVEYRNIQQYALDYSSYIGTTSYNGLSSAYKSIAYGDYTYWGVTAKRQLTKNTSASLFYEKYNPQSHGSTAAKQSQVEDNVYRLQVDVAF